MNRKLRRWLCAPLAASVVISTVSAGFTHPVKAEASTVVDYALLGTAGTSVGSSKLDPQYSTNPNGAGIKKTVTVDGDISDWDSSMLIAQGAANDDPRVYRENSMHEIPIDMYALYGCYDDTNLYLMWEMTNVQDVVAPEQDYPLSQGLFYKYLNAPIFIAVDTNDSTTRIGNNCMTADGKTLWDSEITFTQNVNKIVAISTNGYNGPFVYGGDSTGINAKEEHDPKTAGVKFKFDTGVLSKKIMGINGGYGPNSVIKPRIPGDMTTGDATYVDFNTMGHDSATLDFHYEMSIPLATLGTTAAKVASNGLGVMVITTTGVSGMDCLPYDIAMNNNADLPDTRSQEINSYEKSDPDEMSSSFARIGKSGEVVPEELKISLSTDKASPQTAGTSITLKGSANGGTAPYTYKYYVNNVLLDTKSGSGDTSTTWTPKAGSYTIKCEVTDAEGKTVSDDIEYTVEGTEVLTGWQERDGKWYYYNSEGVMQTSKWILGMYYVKADGSMATSEIVEGKYYVDDNGKWVTGTKWVKIDEKWYYISSGVIQKSKWIGGTYYVKADGSMAVSELVDNGRYYVDGNGKWVNSTKWLKLDGKWYYLVSGRVQMSKWTQVGTKWYHFDSTGVMETSKWISGVYYVKADGSMAVSEWVDGGRYYVGADGKWIKGYVAQ